MSVETEQSISRSFEININERARFSPFVESHSRVFASVSHFGGKKNRRTPTEKLVGDGTRKYEGDTMRGWDKRERGAEERRYRSHPLQLVTFHFHLNKSNDKHILRVARSSELFPLLKPPTNLL